MTEVARPERRKFPRIALKGTVIFLAGEHAQRGRIANLGMGGLLALTAVTAPERLLARKVDLELRLDGKLARWQRLAGRIQRIRAESIAVAFDGVPAGFGQMMEEIATDLHTRERVFSVVLVDDNADRRNRLLDAFRQVGATVLAVATSLEAIVILGEASFEPDLIAVADAAADKISRDLRTFVEREHPHVKLVTIGDEVLAPEGLAMWLSAADPEADLVTRMRALMLRPRT